MIQITKKYAVNADNVSFTIYKRKKRKGKVTWVPEWYYTDLSHIFQKLVSLAVAEGIRKGSWEDVAREVYETKAMIRDKMAVLTSIEIGRTSSG